MHAGLNDQMKYKAAKLSVANSPEALNKEIGPLINMITTFITFDSYLDGRMEKGKNRGYITFSASDYNDTSEVDGKTKIIEFARSSRAFVIGVLKDLAEVCNKPELLTLTDQVFTPSDDVYLGQETEMKLRSLFAELATNESIKPQLAKIIIKRQNSLIGMSGFRKSEQELERERAARESQSTDSDD